MAQYCPCSGPLTTSVPEAEVTATLRTLASVAAHHRLEWLGETTRWLLGMGRLASAPAPAAGAGARTSDGGGIGRIGGGAGVGLVGGPGAR